MNREAFQRAALRVLAAVACVVALADPRLVGGAAPSLPVAILDVSESTGAGPVTLPDGLRVRPTWVLVADGVQEVAAAAPVVRIGRGRTQLGAGLRHVATTSPGATVLLLTDGRDTDGDAEAAARALAQAGGRLFVAPVAAPAADVGLRTARLLQSREKAIIRAEIGSSTTGTVEVRLSRSGDVVDRRTLGVQAGQVQEADLTDPAPPPEGCTYRVVLVPDAATPDDDEGNDRLAVGLLPEQRVVLAWGLPEADALSLGRGVLVRTTTELLPDDLDGVDAVVLADLPWRAIGTEVTDALVGFVARGGRLLLLGGPDAFAGGGWSGTPLEDRLAPLRVPRREGTGLAIVLAVDRSGSTRGAALAHLVEAAHRALQGVVPGERVGVLSFAARPDGGLLPPGDVGFGEVARRTALFASLDALEAHGDTDLPAAVEEAARLVGAIPARERRVVLLTDGDPEDPPDEQRLQAVARALEARDVRFGALVVGDELAAARLRSALGRAPDDVQLLDRAGDLPASLLHHLGDLRHRAEALPRPDRLVPATPPSAPFPLEGFQVGAVQRVELAGALGARALVLATYAGGTPPAVPFAAIRAVGSGEVAALAWGPALEVPGARAALLARVGPWLAQLASAADRGLRADFDGDAVVLRHAAATGQGALLLEASDAAAAASLIEVEPGLFRGPLPDDAGPWWVGSAGAGEGRRPLRLPARPSAEHRGSGPDEVRMQALAAAGGGRRLGPGEQPPAAPSQGGPPLAPWLLLAACILLVADRRLAKPGGRGAGARPTPARRTARP